MHTVIINITGGTAPYVVTTMPHIGITFTFTTAGQKTISNIPDGTHTIIVTDKNNCVAENVVVFNSEATNDSISAGSTVDATLTAAYNAPAVALESDFVIPRAAGMCGEQAHSIAPCDFLFTDAENNQLVSVKIVSLPTIGQLTINYFTPVTVGQILTLSDVCNFSSLVMYKIPDDAPVTSYIDTFEFQVMTFGATEYSNTATGLFKVTSCM